MRSTWLAFALVVAATFLGGSATEATLPVAEGTQGCDLALGAVCMSGCSSGSLTPLEIRVNGHEVVPCVG